MPEYQGIGIGRLIVKNLEKDDYARKSKKIIVPSSITAKSFYLKLGYKSKYQSDIPNEDGLFILEKSKNIWIVLKMVVIEWKRKLLAGKDGK